MSATAYYEPHKVPAGVLALVVHSLFFALLYFGFNWNRQVFSNPSMTVQLWSSLPEAPVAQRVPAKVEVVSPPQPQQKAAEPDIVMPEKKKVMTKPLEAKPEKMKPAPKITQEVKPKPDAKTLAEQDAEKQIADQQAALEQAERAKQDEQAAAIGKVVDEYKAKIHDKIRHNVVNPQGVAKDARAEFLVTLIPGGVVLNTKLIKSSGNAAYDDAVERAILKSNPLPVPQDVQLFSRFRELDLVFKPDTNDETN
ncbi:MAG: TonB C-terminal domain-containing protein [Gallionella sp.]